ncbi:MAG: glycosyltransferase family 2 protein [Firmicutes bacterium]|nr:glycosyltransferase family 2 protein [Bacillota bacterium]
MKDIAIIIPSLDPDEKMVNTVGGMIAAGFEHVVMVDDGSHEENKKYFAEAMEKYPAQCDLIVHEVNKGKGRALRDAFAWVSDNLPDVRGVITVDGDGQHTPEDTVRLAKEMEARPGSVILGCRDFSLSHVPTHNRLGNRISSFVYRVVYGIKLSDTQTGLRAVPAEYLRDFAEKVEGDRYEYETNMLIYIKDKGIPYGEIPIQTVYIDDNSSSHFNVIKDSYRIYKPIILFVLGSCIATVVDLVVFSILNALTEKGVGVFAAAAAFINRHFIKDYTTASLFIPTAVARIVSSLVDYNFSRTKVFGSKAPARKTIWKYYIICAVRMLLSWLFLSFLTNILHAQGLIVTLLKVVVDLILFFISYNWQRTWVFKKH